MTNEELDRARVDEAIRNGNGIVGSVALIAARLAREGWMPPVAVDPDIAEAREIVAQIYDVSWPERADAIRAGGQDNNVENVSALAGIKRGRALAAEAKPGVVWVKHDGSRKNPLDRRNSWILVNRAQRGFGAYYSSNDAMLDWRDVTHYAVITPPEEK